MTAEVSIIIPAWHEEKTIVRTLVALKQLNYPLKECELIITASAEDNTHSIAQRNSMSEFSRYLVLKQEPGGKNVALHQGIKEAKGEIIVLLDADTIVDKDWLSELTKPIKSGEVVCTNGNFFPLSPSWMNNYFIIEKIWARNLLKQQSTNGQGGIAFKRALISLIGSKVLFNGKILIGVDHYFGEQLIKRGYRIYFAEKAKTRTYFNSTFKGFVHRESRWLNGYAKLITKSRLVKIIAFNLSICSSFILSFYSRFFLLIFSIYLFYLLIQSIFSSVKSSDINLLLYFPVYSLLNLFDRIMALIIFSKELLGLNKRVLVHFKGERK
jgi:cellulose synthase/poly-beta-1,6-N-acetylglucosamine synthase-like glycosyltransferase